MSRPLSDRVAGLIVSADRGPPLPEDAGPYRTIGPFDADTIPSGLLKMHNLKAGAWGLLTVEAGTIRFCWDDEAGGGRDLRAGDVMLVPPLVPHHLEREGTVTITIAFCAQPASPAPKATAPPA
jgi:cupin 2 domain-containing protein